MNDAPDREGERPRSRFITWFLVGTGAVVAFLSLCQRQKTLDKLTEWEFHLRSAGRVLVLSDRDDLGSSRVESLQLVDGDEEPGLLELARGSDEEAFARALADAGFGGVIVGTERDEEPSGGPAPVQVRLARFRPGRHMQALMLRPGAGLYAPALAPDIPDEVMGFLVRAARQRLAGEDAEAAGAGAPHVALAERLPDGIEVALQVQGLGPRPVRTARANQIRQDLVATGAGLTLLDAVLDAADGIAERHESAHASKEGPLAAALERYRIELHVLHSFTLLAHPGGGEDAAAYRAFLDRALEPGVTGLAVGWTPLSGGRALGRRGFRIRLPCDAVYWSRKSGTRIAERLLLDARLGKLEDLGKRPHVSLDLFRSIHVMETEPGGEAVRMLRGIAARPPREDPASLLERVAVKIAADMSAVGELRQSYYPVRDLLRLGTARESGESAHMHGLGLVALDAAAATLGHEALAAAADRAAGRMTRWLRACPGVELGPEPAVGAEQVLEHCGPVDVTGGPVAVSSWRPGPGEAGAPPDGLVFVVDHGTARLGTSALALLGLVAHVERDPGAGRSRRLGPLVGGLVEFILAMQRGDGSFQSHFVVPDHGLHAIEEPDDAGMALLALARASSLVEDPRIASALERGFAANAALLETVASGTWPSARACTRLDGHVPWVAFAAVPARDLVPGPVARAAAIDGPRLLATGCRNAGGTPGARDVLVAAASAGALLLGPGGDGDARVHEEALEAGFQLALRLVVTPGVNDHFLPVPGKALGGVGRDLMDHRQGPDSALAVVALLSRLVRSSQGG